AEIAAPGCTARIVRHFPGHCGKVLAGLNALPGLLRPLTGCGTGFGVTFRCADENVLRADGDILRGTDVEDLHEMPLAPGEDGSDDSARRRVFEDGRRNGRVQFVRTEVGVGEWSLGGVRRKK